MRELDRNASGRGKPQLMVDGGIRAHKKVIKTFKKNRNGKFLD